MQPVFECTVQERALLGQAPVFWSSLARQTMAVQHGMPTPLLQQAPCRQLPAAAADGASAGRQRR